MGCLAGGIICLAQDSSPASPRVSIANGVSRQAWLAAPGELTNRHPRAHCCAPAGAGRASPVHGNRHARRRPPNFPRHKLAGALAAKALGLRHTGARRVERVCLQPALPRASATYCRLSSRPRALPHCLLYYIQTAAVPPSRLVHTPPPSPSPLSGNCQPSRLHPHHLLRQPQPHLPNPTPRLHTQW